MIIYGSRPAHLKTVQPSIPCSSCGQTGTLTLSAYSKHAHIFWIPLFPIGRLGISQCAHCKLALDDAGMAGDLKREYHNLKAETRVPIWQFSGLAVIVVIIALITYSGKEDEKKQLEYVADPAVGDIYKYKTETGNYSILKVVAVSADSVFVSPNEYETDRMSGVYKLDKAENYPDFSYGISKNQIKQMHAASDIYDIDRN
jgi:hypothetical protein